MVLLHIGAFMCGKSNITCAIVGLLVIYESEYDSGSCVFGKESNVSLHVYHMSRWGNCHTIQVDL